MIPTPPPAGLTRYRVLRYLQAWNQADERNDSAAYSAALRAALDDPAARWETVDEFYTIVEAKNLVAGIEAQPIAPGFRRFVLITQVAPAAAPGGAP